MQLGQNGAFLRRHNRSLVLWMLRNRGPISRRQICEETGLGPATVTSLMAGLIDEGLVEVVGKSPARSTEGGRSRILLDLKPAGAMVAGIHLGVRRVQVALADQRGTLHATDSRLRRAGAGPEETVAFAGRMLDGLLRRLPGTAIRGTGVSVPVVVDVDTGTIPHAPELEWGDGIRLAPLLRHALPQPVVVGNSRNGMLLAESLFGAARGEAAAILLHPASTMGAAFMVGHRIIQPSHVAASRIGHVVIDPHGPPCECGARGCLNAVAGDRALIELARRRLGRPLEPVDLLGMTEDGDRAARSIVTGAVRAIATAASHAILMLDIDLLLVSGWIAESRGAVLDDLRRRVAPHVERVTGRAPRIVAGDFGTSPQLVSAVSLALDRFVYRSPGGSPISWSGDRILAEVGTDAARRL
jgi:predicted NBD/HSP70 family sugar kinase